MKDTEVKSNVRERYAQVVLESQSCCGPKKPDSKQACGCNSNAATRDISKSVGYTDEDLAAAPEESNLGLGCGNPVALASLKEGETVLDLGSGAGFDCFLAAKKVGESGRVIGVDMTPEMLDKARENARNGDYTNVEFRLGEIENLPVADSSVNAIISNCVINLAPDKKRVFKEAFRVLRAGGRVMVSDIVLTQPLPEIIKNSVEAYVGCIAGASLESDYLAAIRGAGFEDIKVVEETVFPIESVVSEPEAAAIMKDLKLTPGKMRETARTVKSIKVHAVKPDNASIQGV
jgi:arsenite methyltransferase